MKHVRVGRVVPLVAVASLVVGAAGFVALTSSVASAVTNWTAATPIPGVAHGLWDVSCSDASNCTAVGGNGIVTETAGTWGPDTPVAGAEFLRGVDCSDALDCTAVGYSPVHNTTSQPLYITETAGVWGAATQLPATPDSDFLSVSCSDSTNCTAVGGDGNNQPIYATETNGVWGAVTEIPAPPGLGPNIQGGAFGSVSCVDPGDCTAVGGDDNALAMYATEIGGTWGPTVEVSFGAAEAGLLGVSCAPGNVCTAVGYLGGPAVQQAFAVTAPGGNFAAGSVTNVAAGVMVGVDCSDSTDCTAVGVTDYKPAAVNETAGVWGTVTQIADTGAQGAQAVSCSDVNDCTMVGYGGINTSNFYATSAEEAPVVRIFPSPIPAVPGSVPYTVTVTGTGPAPTGSVEVSDDQGGSCAILLSAGSGTCSLTESAAAGPYTVSAEYSGDGDYAAASSSLVVSAGVSAGGSASIGTGGVTATAGPGGTDGVDTVTETPYGSDPVRALSDASDYFDVVVSPGNTFAGVTIEDCRAGVNNDTVLNWWNPVANGGSGAWAPVTSPAGATAFPFGQTFTDGTPPCVSVVIDANSSPSLAQLTGTVFGLSRHGGTVVLSKSTKLIGNKYTVVSGAGWKVNGDSRVSIYECAGPTYSADTCDSASHLDLLVKTAPASMIGRIGPTNLRLVAGAIDTNGDTCGVAGSSTCYVVVVGDTGDMTSSAALSFDIPTVTLAKTTGVLGNVVDKVIARHFPIGDTIHAVQCDSTVTASNLATNCDGATQISGTAGTTGTVIFSPAGVAVKVDGSYSDGANGNACNTGSTCAVVVTDVDNSEINFLSASIALAAPTVTVAPAKVATGNGHTLTVSARHFPIGDTVDAVECDSDFLGGSVADNCDAATQITGTVAASGTVVWSPTKITVLTTATGPAYSDTAGGSCASGGPSCYVFTSDTSTTGISATSPFSVK